MKALGNRAKVGDVVLSFLFTGDSGKKISGTRVTLNKSEEIDLFESNDSQDDVSYKLYGLEDGILSLIPEKFLDEQLLIKLIAKAVDFKNVGNYSHIVRIRGAYNSERPFGQKFVQVVDVFRLNEKQKNDIRTYIKDPNYFNFKLYKG